MRESMLSDVLSASYPQLSNETLKAATDGCYIMYPFDNYRYFCPWWEWEKLEIQGQKAEGVVIFEEGLRPIVVACQQTPQGTFCLDGTIVAGSSLSFAEACHDFNGQENCKKIMEMGSQLFGEDEGSWIKYPVPFCNAYSTPSYPSGKWWLPSFGELMLINKKVNAINKCMSVIKGATKIDALYFSSSESNTSIWSIWINRFIQNRPKNHTLIGIPITYLL